MLIFGRTRSRPSSACRCGKHARELWADSHPHLPLRERSLVEVSAGCDQVRAGTTMTDMATVYHRPAGVLRQSVKPQLANWDRAGHPSQVKLIRFLAHVDVIAGPVLARVSGRVVAELIVGFSDGMSLIDGGHDLGNYLYPVAQRLGPRRVAAIFGRKMPPRGWSRRDSTLLCA